MMTSHEATQKRLAFLYPGHASEHDYPHMADRLHPTVVAHVINTDVPEDAHRPDALKRIGDVELLLEKQAEVRTFNPDAAMWACTSGSFVFGLDGAGQQVHKLEEALHVPVSSTSLAFVAAMRELGVESVSIAATYPEDVTQLFTDLVEAAGFTVLNAHFLDILTGVEVGTLEREQIIDFVAASAHEKAEAILVPDTAMASAEFLDQLENVAGTVVLTANQVTMWEALRLADWQGAFPGGGALFDRT